jgi:hypothetical protein
MKYIKTYENINEPEIGDYVIGWSGYFSEKTNDFLKNSIGKITNSKNNGYKNAEYQVNYDNVPEDVYKSEDFYTFIPYKGTRFEKPQYFVKLYRKEINHFSKNKEDLYIYLDSNKYNL